MVLKTPDVADQIKTPRFVALCMLGLFFIFAAHYLQINRSGVGLELPFNAMGWIPLSMLLGAGLYIIGTTQQVYFTPLTVKLACITCLLIAPYFFPYSDVDAAMARMFGLMAGLLVFICLQQFRLGADQRILLLLLVVASVWVELIIGWDRVLRSFGIGISATRPVWLGSPHGIFQQRNLFASYIATGITLSGYLLGYCVKQWGQGFRSAYLVLLLLPLAGMHLLVQMYSRTGWLGLLIGCLLVAPFLWRNAGKKLAGFWLISIFGGWLVSAAIPGNASGSDMSGKELVSVEGLRLIQFPQVASLIMDKPFLGHGYGKFEKSYLEFSAKKYADGETDQPAIARLDHPHNELLFWAAEGGIYALTLLLAAAWFVWRRVAPLPLWHRLAVIGLFFPIVLHTQLEYPFYQSLLHWMVFILLIYWVDGLTGETKVRPVAYVLLPRIAAILIPVMATVFMSTTLHAGYLFARYESGLDPNVESLARIANPVVFSDRINWAVMSRLVLNAAVSDKPEQAQPYIDWAPHLLERKPRPNFYRFLILAYKVVGDEDNMRKWQAEARYLFPDESFETPDLESGLAAPVPFDAVSR